MIKDVCGVVESLGRNMQISGVVTLIWDIMRRWGIDLTAVVKGVPGEGAASVFPFREIGIHVCAQMSESQKLTMQILDKRSKHTLRYNLM